MEFFLLDGNIQYFHFKNLGGRRKANPDSKNTAWKSPAFRGYTDYMETETFKHGIKDLEKIALKDPTVLCVQKPYGGVAIVRLFPII